MRANGRRLALPILSLAAAACAPVGPDIAGSWVTRFDSNVGREKIVYTFDRADGELKGKAVSEAMGRTRNEDLYDIEVEDDRIAFKETLRIPNNDVTIEYTGTVQGDEMPLTRKVGDFATQQIVACRVGSPAAIAAEEAIAKVPAPRPQFRRPALAEDDVPAFPPAPRGFDQARDGVERGKVERVEYDSSVTGTKRPLVIYTPPGYSADKPLPVFYLLHGIGDLEGDWSANGAAGTILDNLIAEGKARPTIVVMPNGRADPNMTPRTPWDQQGPAFAAFERDLLDCVIPFVESRYAVRKDRESRALAGLSMGGGQSLNFGLSNLDRFAWVGGFSSAPIAKPMRELIPDADAANARLRLLWVSCGDEDFILATSQTIHRQLKELGVKHTWHIDKGGHSWPVWKNDLFLLSQLLFRGGR